MPWKETNVMNERMKFIGQLLSGEKMARVCREFGSKGIYDQSRAPHKHPNQTPLEIENLIIRLKKEKPNWGAPKIREIISNKYPTIKLPATSTIHSILDRHELVKKRRNRRKFKAMASYLSVPKEPNDLWCTDFKGQFRMENRKYCYPLTLSDFVSRFLISCEALDSTEESPCFPVFEQAFKEYGLPTAIRSDNGIPFASGNSLWNLTKLSVWWIRLGIKLETTNPPRTNLLQQQETFDDFKLCFNSERPHQALDMKFPEDVYRKSRRIYKGLSDICYPDSDKTILISNCGRICC